MFVDNVRIIARTRLPRVPPIGFLHTAETYYYMMERTEPDPCLVFDVTVHKGDKKPLASEKFVYEFMEKNCPGVVFHLERHLEAFDGIREKLYGRQLGIEHGKAFVYYYCYSEDKEAINKLYRFVRSKLFMTKVEKHLAEPEEIEGDE